MSVTSLSHRTLLPSSQKSNNWNVDAWHIKRLLGPCASPVVGVSFDWLGPAHMSNPASQRARKRLSYFFSESITWPWGKWVLWAPLGICADACQPTGLQAKLLSIRCASSHHTVFSWPKWASILLIAALVPRRQMPNTRLAAYPMLWPTAAGYTPCIHLWVATVGIVIFLGLWESHGETEKTVISQ